MCGKLIGYLNVIIIFIELFYLIVLLTFYIFCTKSIYINAYAFYFHGLPAI